MSSSHLISLVSLALRFRLDTSTSDHEYPHRVANLTLLKFLFRSRWTNSWICAAQHRSIVAFRGTDFQKHVRQKHVTTLPIIRHRFLNRTTIQRYCKSNSRCKLRMISTPASRHRHAGVEIIGNGSGSHHQLLKLDDRIDLI